MFLRKHEGSYARLWLQYLLSSWVFKPLHSMIYILHNQKNQNQLMDDCPTFWMNAQIP